MSDEIRANKNDFLAGDMWRHITKMGIPLVIAQLVNVLYNLVDRMYIGHIDSSGSAALGGLGIVMPLITILSAFANLCGTGGGPFCSIARGRRDLEEASRIMGNAFFLVIGFAVILTVFFEADLRNILILFGADGDTLQYAVEYARIYILGSIFSMTSLTMTFFVNAQGFSKKGMAAVMIGALINVILDPIFIFAFGMGVSGAALASVIAQFIAAAYIMLFLTGKKAVLELSLRTVRPRLRLIKKICALGLSGFIINITASVVNIFCNRQLLFWGGSLYVSSMTIVFSVREVIFNVIHSYTNGAQPVLGYNYGAEAYGRLREGIRFLLAVCVVYGTAAWVVTEFLSYPLIGIFTDDPALTEVAVKGLKIYFLGFIVLSLQVAGQSVFVGLGFAKLSIFFALLRKIILILPLVFFLPPLFGLGPYGVFLAEPISDIVSGLVCVFALYFCVYRKVGGEGPAGKAEGSF